MKVLVGCERSGVVREAFRALGHDAWSCDLEPADDGSEFHIRTDVLHVLREGWGLAIFHPDCTYLANSGALRLWRGGQRGNGPDFGRFANMVVHADFFLHLLNAPIPKICIENPIMHGHALQIVGQKPSQIIQPWEFGDDASKATCLWLKGLPRLRPTDILPGGRKARRANQTASGQNKLGPSEDRKRIRAQTYPGIAAGMAEQWGGPAMNEAVVPGVDQEARP